MSGIFSPKDPALADEGALSAMLETIEHSADAGRRVYLEPKAGLAMGQVRGSAFRSAGEEPASGWGVSEKRVMSLHGSVFGHGVESQAGAAMAAYTDEPAGFPAELEGYFCLALWDGQDQSLRIASDQQGMLPFYYFDAVSRLLVFGSEIKAVVAHRAIRREVDQQALAVYRRLGYTLPPATIFGGVRAGMAGQALDLEKGGEPRLSNYRNLPAVETVSQASGDWAEAVHEALVANVASVTACAARPGVFLSGGVESTALLAALTETSGSASSFTISFQGAGEDDLHWAEVAAGEAGARHRAVRVGPEEIRPEVLSRVYQQFDGLQDATGRGISHYFVSQAAPEDGVTSCLSGTEGERVFGSIYIWEKYLGGGGEPLASLDLEALTKLYIGETETLGASQQDRFMPTAVPACPIIAQQLTWMRERIDSSAGFDVLNGCFLLRQGTSQTTTPTNLVPPLTGVEARYGYINAYLFDLGRSMPMELRRSGAGSLDRGVLPAAFRHRTPSLMLDHPPGAMPGLPWRQLEAFGKFEALILGGVERLAGNQLFRREKILGAMSRYLRKPGSARQANRLHLLFSFYVWHEFYIEGRDPFADLPSKW